MQFGQACSEHWHNPPASFQLTDFRFTRAGYRRLLPLAEIYNATDPNLSAFSRAGGKLILWQSWADEKVSPFGTVSHYKAVVQHAPLPLDRPVPARR